MDRRDNEPMERRDSETFVAVPLSWLLGVTEKAVSRGGGGDGAAGAPVVSQAKEGQEREVTAFVDRDGYFTELPAVPDACTVRYVFESLLGELLATYKEPMYHSVAARERLGRAWLELWDRAAQERG